jgi:hypothetical protein
MTREEAKQALMLYRGNAADAADPEIREALAVAAADPELKDWVERQVAFHSTIREKLRGIKVPAESREELLASTQPSHRSTQPLNHRSTEPPTLRHRTTLAIAAMFVLLGFLAFMLFRPDPAPDRFEHFQARMVGTALRQYRMDIVTNDMRQVRQFMASQGAPSDYKLPPGLENLHLTGGGALVWRSNPVAMVCFDRGDEQMLFLFVTRRSNLKDPPPAQPQVQQISELATASWSEGEMTYLLAGPNEPGFTDKYLQRL